MNLLTGLGVKGADKRKSTTFAGAKTLNQQTLTDLYTGDGFAQRIVNLVAKDMVREWFKVHGDDEGLLLQGLDTLRAKNHFARALRWSRLYGGSAMVMGIDDGGELQDELREESIRNVEFLRVYNRHQLSPQSTYTSPEHKSYGKPETYMVSSISGSPYVVHESRMLKFDGVDVPDDVRAHNNGWGNSVLQSTYDRIRGLGEAYANVESIINEFVIGTLTVRNLAELLASGQESLVHARLNQIDLSKHIINTVLLDENERFERVTSTVSGLDGLIDKLEKSLSAVTGIPVTLLMGESPAGLQATGASDIRLYYDSVAADQEVSLQPQLETMLRILMLAKQGPFGGKELDSWTIEFSPLWQPTEKEVAETKKIVADADHIYLLDGVVLPEEIAQSRFGGGQYSADTRLMYDRTRPSIDRGEQ